MIDWDKKTPVHVLNKREIGHPELTKIRATRRNTIAIGDSLSDADMVEGDENVLRLRIYDPRSDEQTNANARQQTLRIFDAMIETGSFEPICRLGKYILGQAA